MHARPTLVPVNVPNVTLPVIVICDCGTGTFFFLVSARVERHGEHCGQTVKLRGDLVKRGELTSPHSIGIRRG